MNTSDAPSLTMLPGSPHSPHKALPPLTSQYPQWSRGGKLGVEKLYQKCDGSVHRVNKDTKVNKKGPDFSSVGRSEGLMVTPTADPLLRITQLEQNIRFLQEQHQLMLASLHQEVEQLRQRNRDLQFQLVFLKDGVSLAQSSPSSPEDDSKPKVILSPKQANVTPLQIELLEKEIAELKATLHEAKTKNVYLSGIVEEQRKKLESLECDRQEPEAPGYKGKSASLSQASAKGCDERGDSEDLDLATKLEEAEKVIRRLRRDNDEHRRELVTIKANISKSMGGAGGSRQLGPGPGGGGHRGGGGNNHHRPHSQQAQSQRFPPLHSQSYWHHGQHSQHRSGIEFVSHRHCANGRGGGNNGIGNGTRVEKDSQAVGRPVPSLPNLRNNSSNHYPFSNGNSNNNGHNHRRGGGGHYNGNSNHYYRGGKGGGRGNREPREVREAK